MRSRHHALKWSRYSVQANYFRFLGAGTARTAGLLSRRPTRGRTRPKSFHARWSAETGIYSRFSFINQAPSFHAAPLPQWGVAPLFSHLIDAVYRDRNREICP